MDRAAKHFSLPTLHDKFTHKIPRCGTGDIGSAGLEAVNTVESVRVDRVSCDEGTHKRSAHTHERKSVIALTVARPIRHPERMAGARPESRARAAVIYRVFVHSYGQRHERTLVDAVIQDVRAKTFAPARRVPVPLPRRSVHPGVPTRGKCAAGECADAGNAAISESNDLPVGWEHVTGSRGSRIRRARRIWVAGLRRWIT